MAYSSLTGFISATMNAPVVGAVTASGLNLPGAGGGTTISPKTSYTLGSGAGAAQLEIQTIQTISASSSVTIDVTAATDVIGLVTASIAKFKAFIFWLLTAAQDSVNGSAASSITIGNAASLSVPLGLGGTTPTYTVNNGAWLAQGDPTSAGICTVSTNKNLKIANNDGALAAGVFIGILAT